MVSADSINVDVESQTNRFEFDSIVFPFGLAGCVKRASMACVMLSPPCSG